MIVDLCTLKKGANLWKVTTNPQKPFQSRWLQLTGNEQNIEMRHTQEARKFSLINCQDLKSVTPGWPSPAKPPPNATEEAAGLAMTLLFFHEGQEHYICLVANDENQFKSWFQGLWLLVQRSSTILHSREDGNLDDTRDELTKQEDDNKPSPIGYMVAELDYVPQSDREMRLKKGEEVVVVEFDPSGWVGVEKNGRLAWVPASVVARYRPIVPVGAPPPRRCDELRAQIANVTSSYSTDTPGFFQKLVAGQRLYIIRSEGSFAACTADHTNPELLWAPISVLTKIGEAELPLPKHIPVSINPATDYTTSSLSHNLTGTKMGSLGSLGVKVKPLSSGESPKGSPFWPHQQPHELVRTSKNELGVYKTTTTTTITTTTDLVRSAGASLNDKLPSAKISAMSSSTQDDRSTAKESDKSADQKESDKQSKSLNQDKSQWETKQWASTGPRIPSFGGATNTDLDPHKGTPQADTKDVAMGEPYEPVDGTGSPVSRPLYPPPKQDRLSGWSVDTPAFGGSNPNSPRYKPSDSIPQFGFGAIHSKLEEAAKQDEFKNRISFDPKNNKISFDTKNNRMSFDRQSNESLLKSAVSANRYGGTGGAGQGLESVKEDGGQKDRWDDKNAENDNKWNSNKNKEGAYSKDQRQDNKINNKWEAANRWADNIPKQNETNENKRWSDAKWEDNNRWSNDSEAFPVRKAADDDEHSNIDVSSPMAAAEDAAAGVCGDAPTDTNACSNIANVNQQNIDRNNTDQMKDAESHGRKNPLGGSKDTAKDSTSTYNTYIPQAYNTTTNNANASNPNSGIPNSNVTNPPAYEIPTTKPAPPPTTDSSSVAPIQVSTATTASSGCGALGTQGVDSGSQMLGYSNTGVQGSLQADIGIQRTEVTSCGTQEDPVIPKLDLANAGIQQDWMEDGIALSKYLAGLEALNKELPVWSKDTKLSPRKRELLQRLLVERQAKGDLQKRLEQAVDVIKDLKKDKRSNSTSRQAVADTGAFGYNVKSQMSDELQKLQSRSEQMDKQLRHLKVVQSRYETYLEEKFYIYRGGEVPPTQPTARELVEKLGLGELLDHEDPLSGKKPPSQDIEIDPTGGVCSRIANLKAMHESKAQQSNQSQEVKRLREKNKALKAEANSCVHWLLENLLDEEQQQVFLSNLSYLFPLNSSQTSSPTQMNSQQNVSQYDYQANQPNRFQYNQNIPQTQPSEVAKPKIEKFETSNQKPSSQWLKGDPSTAYNQEPTHNAPTHMPHYTVRVQEPANFTPRKSEKTSRQSSVEPAANYAELDNSVQATYGTASISVSHSNISPRSTSHLAVASATKTTFQKAIKSDSYSIVPTIPQNTDSQGVDYLVRSIDRPEILYPTPHDGPSKVEDTCEVDKSDGNVMSRADLTRSTEHLFGKGHEAIFYTPNIAPDSPVDGKTNMKGETPLKKEDIRSTTPIQKLRERFEKKDNPDEYKENEMPYSARARGVSSSLECEKRASVSSLGGMPMAVSKDDKLIHSCVEVGRVEITPVKGGRITGLMERFERSGKKD